MLRGRPGYEHLNDPLHILIEAELPASVVDVRLMQAQEIIQELLKPVVSLYLSNSVVELRIYSLMRFSPLLLSLIIWFTLYLLLLLRKNHSPLVHILWF